ncbi:hypothetical protein A2311_00020 [candidate division WOR-1 bacterium RIFOXYB2_FULL_48_7]|uniref:Uncharacterized protein n=1 Tax=candidate division WOR-1 bacterium RIFOXYB2_FULL_48_7 TaxID=1802583 RepID=A0A1F4TJI8_UNCSA|nr:MAG: hypothetical protein A2311_00020 [candidate division WOR-1 bacterium RIFOXYB2_FULL_48_7]
MVMVERRTEPLLTDDFPLETDRQIIYFINQTPPEYQPMIYGAAFKPWLWTVGETLKKLLFWSKN